MGRGGLGGVVVLVLSSVMDIDSEVNKGLISIMTWYKKFLPLVLLLLPLVTDALRGGGGAFVSPCDDDDPVDDGRTGRGMTVVASGPSMRSARVKRMKGLVFKDMAKS